MPLRLVITVTVMLGLMLPAVIGGWQTLRYRQDKLLHTLRQEQEHMADSLALALSEPAWDLDHGAAMALLNSAGRDERVVDISVDNLNFKRWVSVDRPERRHGAIVGQNKTIVRNGKPFATLHLNMDSGYVNEQVAEDLRHFLLTTAAQLAVSLALILFMLDLRFTRPLRRLLQESVDLAQRRLERPFVWMRGDELGELGQSLESTRTALHQAFAELEESEGRFRSLTALSSDWYWEQDEHGRFTLLSPNYADVTGNPPQLVIGKTRADLAEINEYVNWDSVQPLIAARLPFRDLEFRSLLPGSRMRYGSVSGEPVFDSAGNFRGYRGIGRDLTAAKAGEEARHSEIRLRRLVEHLPAGAIHIEGDALFLNQAAETITGYHRSEIATLDQWFDKLYNEHAETVRARYEADRAAGFPGSRQAQIRRKDGELVTVEFAAFCDEHSEVWLLNDVTRRVEAEQALHDTLREQQILLDNALVGIQFVKDRVIRRCNRGWEEMLGYGPGELTGSPTRVYYASDESYRAHGEWVYSLLAAGRDAIGEWEYMRKDGERIWCSFHGRLIDPDDPAKGSIWVEQDVTARKEAEHKLAESEARLRSLLELTSDEYWEQDEQFRFTLSPLSGAFRASGAPLPSLIGKTRWELDCTVGVSDEQWAAHRMQLEAHQPFRNFEYGIVDGQGEVHYADVSGEPVFDADGEFRGYRGVAADVTLRHLAEEALRQALQEQQTLFDNATVGIEFSHGRIYQRVNRWYAEMFGYRVDELIGQSAEIMFFSAESFQDFGAATRMLIESGQVATGEWQLKRKDGSPIWCSYFARAVDPDDPAAGTIWVLQDITQRKRDHAALLEANEKLEQGLAELAQLNREVTLLSDLSGLLQACQSEDEAYRAVGSFGAQLFPQAHGVLYMHDGSSPDLHNAVDWGGAALPARIEAADCWALRRGQPYRVRDTQLEMCCNHVQQEDELPSHYLCVPLVAQDETIGLLYLGDAEPEIDGAGESRLRLAIAFAEQSALALANLRLRQRLHRQTILDPLTGLYNRRYLQEALKRELARSTRKQRSFAVAMLDIDHFKHFNDDFGHDAGDLVLQQVAQQLRQTVREGDIVCRYGGEEFVLLMPDTDPPLSENRVASVLNDVRQLELWHDGQPLGRVTLSLGLAFYPQHGESPDELLGAADQALYQAKRSGRDRFVVYQPDKND
jgi:diguanylate cyclase (GGDEF)-like protein/PAS domain S-box-containing protein